MPAPPLPPEVHSSAQVDGRLPSPPKTGAEVSRVRFAEGPFLMPPLPRSLPVRPCCEAPVEIFVHSPAHLRCESGPEFPERPMEVEGTFQAPARSQGMPSNPPQVARVQAREAQPQHPATERRQPKPMQVLGAAQPTPDTVPRRPHTPPPQPPGAPESPRLSEPIPRPEQKCPAPMEVEVIFQAPARSQGMPSNPPQVARVQAREAQPQHPETERRQPKPMQVLGSAQPTPDTVPRRPHTPPPQPPGAPESPRLSEPIPQPRGESQPRPQLPRSTQRVPELPTPSPMPSRKWALSEAPAERLPSLKGCPTMRVLIVLWPNPTNMQPLSSLLSLWSSWLWCTFKLGTLLVVSQVSSA